MKNNDKYLLELTREEAVMLHQLIDKNSLKKSSHEAINEICNNLEKIYLDITQNKTKMTWMDDDITFCQESKCRKRKTCHRYLMWLYGKKEKALSIVSMTKPKETPCDLYWKETDKRVTSIKKELLKDESNN